MFDGISSGFLRRFPAESVASSSSLFGFCLWLCSCCWTVYGSNYRKMMQSCAKFCFINRKRGFNTLCLESLNKLGGCRARRVTRTACDPPSPRPAVWGLHGLNLTSCSAEIGSLMLEPPAEDLRQPWRGVGKRSEEQGVRTEKRRASSEE